MKKILTSESVNIGHPDKTCDVIADAFLDEALRQDSYAQFFGFVCGITINHALVVGTKFVLYNCLIDVRTLLGYF